MLYWGDDRKTDYVLMLTLHIWLNGIMLSVAMRWRLLPFSWLLLSIYLSAVRMMSTSLCLSASCLSWWYSWTGDDGALSFCDQKTVEGRESALVACLVTSSWGPLEILSNIKIFQPCPFEYVLVCHFIHPGYPHDWTQMSHHEEVYSFV